MHPTLRHMMGLDMITGADPLGGAMSPAMSPGTPGYTPDVSGMPSRGFRGLFLGFGPTAVGGGLAQNFSAQPSLIVRASRVMALATIASLFSINDLRIGRNTQLLSQNSVPAAAFAENAVDSGIRGDTCNVGQLISLSVTNNTTGSLVFSGGVFGVALDG